MKKLMTVIALGLLASGLFAQGLNTGGQARNDWEEINFEFNSSILSDGYPSLLRLAELMSQHRDYRVKVTGHTDSVGSAAYNDKLALSRANSVKAFLVKYGVADNQVTTVGDGKRSPEVDNKTKEGRFMNRRVVLTVTDGSGRLIKEGSVGEVIPALEGWQKDLAGKQQECCDLILKKLDKLDDILAALKNLQGDNDKLRAEMSDLRNQQNALRDQVNGLSKPLSSAQTEEIAHKEAVGALDEAQSRNKKFSLLGANIGPTLGAGRTGDFTFSGRGQFFSPFGGDGKHAVQAQGEYMYYPGRQEGQFDIGLVNRWGPVQAGAFGSFKYLNFKQYQSGGGLGQAAFLLDYVFNRGRVGLFATKGFKNVAVLNRMQIGPQSFFETYARVVDQVGLNALLGVWGNAYMEGSVAYLRSHATPSNNSPGADLRLVQPISQHFALTAEGGWNETLLNSHDSGRLAFGFQVGNYIRPKEYGQTKTPVPMEIPRVRYELLTRRVGNTPPVANAGPDQIGVAAGTITLDGSGSNDPDGDPITYSWAQISGPSVSLSGANTAQPTFTAAAGQSYAFRLTVTDTGGLSASATTRVSTTTPSAAQVVRFDATPSNITAGQNSTLTWIVQGATSVSIQPNVGNVALTGSTTVSPTATTTYTLSAVGPAGTVTASTTVTVAPVPAGNPQILSFGASPLNIQPGQQSTLSWTTTGANTVSISGVGTVPINGSTTVSPTTTTTYTLTASSSDGKSVTSTVTVTVAPGVKIDFFTATPSFVPDHSTPVTLAWQTENATSVVVVGASIQPQSLPVNGSIVVIPTTDSTYTLTAYGPGGQSVSATILVNVR